MIAPTARAEMKVIAQPAELAAAGRRVCAAIGTFDGVHLGHQQVIRQMVTDARQHDALALVVTFDRHPAAIVAPERVPPLLYSPAQKRRAIAALGSDAMWLIHFDRAFSEQTGEQFIRGLARDFGRLQSISVGSNFVFGHRRSGNVALLHALGAELRFAVHDVSAVSLDGQVVSSTRIREAAQTGNLHAAAQMLGRPYAISGRVIEGDRLGRQLGFPTANLDVTGRVSPPTGVYAALARSKQETHRAVLNIGRRPTVAKPDAELRVEAHLLNFHGDLYGSELEVTPTTRLREEMKFAGVDALKAQIARDITAARTHFG